DDRGGVVGELRGFVARRTNRAVLLRGLRPDIRSLLYEIQWQEKPCERIQSADFLSGPAEIGAGLAAEAGNLIATTEREQQTERSSQVETLSRLYILQALAQLGWQPVPGATLTAPDVASRLQIQPRHQRLLVRLLGLLADAGVLSRAGERWSIQK